MSCGGRVGVQALSPTALGSNPEAVWPRAGDCAWKVKGDGWGWCINRLGHGWHTATQPAVAIVVFSPLSPGGQAEVTLQALNS